MADTTKRARLLDPDFKYTRSVDTNIRELFDRVRQQLKEEAAMLTSANVKPIRQAKGAK